MDKKRLMLAKRMLNKYWQDIFRNPIYDRHAKCLYSNNGTWYLAQSVDPDNSSGVCLYKAS